nr:hypothetical protein [Angustibacter aerolatus]
MVIGCRTADEGTVGVVEQPAGRLPQAGLLVLATEAGVETVLSLTRAGARGVLLRSARASEPDRGGAGPAPRRGRALAGRDAHAARPAGRARPRPRGRGAAGDRLAHPAAAPGARPRGGRRLEPRDRRRAWAWGTIHRPDHDPTIQARAGRRASPSTPTGWGSTSSGSGSTTAAGGRSSPTRC